MIIHEEYIRKKYYIEIKNCFLLCVKTVFGEINNVDLIRLFGCFLMTLYFYTKSSEQSEDVIIFITKSNKKAFRTIRDNIVYGKNIVTDQNYILIRKMLYKQWNKITKKYIDQINPNITPDIASDKISYDKIHKVIYDTNNNHNKIKIKTEIYDKLFNALLTNNIKEEHINIYIFILCFRYQYFGLYTNTNQLALNEVYKKQLYEKYKIDTELFASPFNYYYPNYYSMFPQLECKFGSNGKFNDITKLKSQWYFSNPPFEEEILRHASKRYISWINKYNSKFITSIPIWNKEPYNLSTVKSNPKKYKDYMALYVILNYINEIKIFNKDELSYTNYTTMKDIFVSNSYIIYLCK